MKLKNCIFILFFIIFPSVSFSQNYFPMEVGNRWDYSHAVIRQGGSSHSQFFSMITDEVEINGKIYYVFSGSMFENYNLLRVENDSLYTFDPVDSSDCLVLVFNKKPFEVYTTCCFKEVQTTSLDSHKVFHYPDTQVSITCSNFMLEGDIFEFSSNWGIIYEDNWELMSETIIRLEGCIISGVTYGTLLDVENASEPGSFELYQNYPNPFNPSTTISYNLPSESHVILALYNTIGQLVKVLVDEKQNTGLHSITLNSEGLSNGVYFYRLKAGNYVNTRKLIIIK